jgi:glycosyltransferase involved in cell wall biosynthesis
MNKKHEITAGELKQYISSMRDCRIMQDGSIEMGPQNGSVSFDLSSFDKMIGCVIKGKRISGDGGIIIKYGESNLNTKIISKIEHAIQVTSQNITKIDILRQPKAYGKILIQGIIIEINEQAEDETTQVIKEPEISPVNWRSIINHCSPYKNIRIVKDKLFASEGGSIKSSNISNIITSPPNVFINNGEFIKFMMPCEILEIKLSSKDNMHYDSLYRNTEHPPIITTNTDVYSNNPVAINKRYNPVNNIISNKRVNTNIMYDSSQSGLNINSFNTVVGAISNAGNGVIMGRHSSFCIPASYMQPDYEYVIVVTARKINGNGKLEVSIVADDKVQDARTLLGTHVNSELFFKLKSGTGADFKIKIGRGPNSVGDLFVERIRLIDGIKKLQPNNSAINNSSVDLFYAPVNFKCNTENIIRNPIILNALSNVPLSNNIDLLAGEDKKFVIVIPSYNNEKWVENNLRSAIQQNYPNYRIIYVDDCSSDKTFIKAREIIDKYNGNIKTTLVKNVNRLGALENLYNAIHSCADDEIVLTLDGDDWLSNENVLGYLNNIYKNKDVWLTYGQYQNHPDGGRGISQQIPDRIIQSNGFRSFVWCSSHLRTFYAWLFKKINKNDLIHTDNKFFSMTWDFAIMFPMLEMARERSAFISDTLYIYNLQNPINDHKVNKNLQASLDKLIRQKNRYDRADLPNNKKEVKHKIGLIIIGTAKYQSFIAPLISSADRYFFNNAETEVSYFIFSDNKQDLLTNRNVKQVHIDHVPFPFASMNRFKYFVENKEIFNDMDYLYYVDVDCLFVNNVSFEVLGDLVNVRHCGYYNGGGSFENNNNSVFFRPNSQYKHYYGGGWQGGRRDNYLQLAEWCYKKIEEDLKNNITPRYHDETAINTYLSETPPTVILDPRYHYPQNADHFIKEQSAMRYLKDMEPIVLLLEKNHEKARA